MINKSQDFKTVRNHKLVILVILCSMSEDRFKIARKVLDSLKFARSTVDCEFLIIDNGSKYKIDDSELPEGATYVSMQKNLGYWGVLYWSLFSQNSPLSTTCSKYLYIVESDHVHFAFEKITDVISALDSFPNIHSARVQEFSVRSRVFFSKEFRFVPFKRKRSLVSTRNAVTKQKVKFRPIEGHKSIYLANWHTRLPSIFRADSLKRAFAELALLPNFTEYNFFEILHNDSPEILVLDTGIYYPESSASNSKRVLSGSWMENYDGMSENYQPTRISSLSPKYLYEKPINIVKIG